MNISPDTQFNNKRIREWLKKELPNFEEEFFGKGAKNFHNQTKRDCPDVTILFEAFLETLNGCKGVEDHNMLIMFMLGMIEVATFRQSLEGKSGDYYYMSKTPELLALAAINREDYQKAKGEHITQMLGPAVNAMLRVLLKKAAK